MYGAHLLSRAKVTGISKFGNCLHYQHLYEYPGLELELVHRMNLYVISNCI